MFLDNGKETLVTLGIMGIVYDNNEEVSP